MGRPPHAVSPKRLLQREFAEVVLNRSEWLQAADRQLLRSIFGDGRPVADLAAMLGVRPRGLNRRVRRLVERLMSPLYVYVALRHAAWPPTRRRVALGCVLQGRSIREVAEELETSVHAVRRHRDAVHALYEAARL